MSVSVSVSVRVRVRVCECHVLFGVCAYVDRKQVKRRTDATAYRSKASSNKQAEVLRRIATAGFGVRSKETGSCLRNASYSNNLLMCVSIVSHTTL